ncbi:MAG: hypothetical protein SF002_05835 [Alphaproteobacteria bacterium]|nr:hypothetical protein [Alphaproteobacteria bacterium]
MVVYAIAALLAGWLHASHDQGPVSAAAHGADHGANHDAIAAVTAALAHSICGNEGEPASDHSGRGGVRVCDGCLVGQSLLPTPLDSTIGPQAPVLRMGWSLAAVAACGGAHPQGACARGPPALM